MKKILLAAVMAAFAFSTADAQIVSSRSVSIKREKTPSTTMWYARVGVNFMKWVGYTDAYRKSNIGYDASVGFHKPLANVNGLYWGMEFGLSSRGNKSSYSEEYNDGDSYKEVVKEIRHNVKVNPFTIGYEYKISNKFKVDGHFGLFASADYVGKQKYEESWVEYGTPGSYDASTSLADYVDAGERFDVGIQLGGGVWYDRYNLDITWQRGFLDPFGNSDARSSNVMIRLGIAF